MIFVSYRRLLLKSISAVLLGLLLLPFATGIAQAQFTRFQAYTDEQGLGNLYVTALAQDADGYMLFGTQGGLYRFDGSNVAPLDVAAGLPPAAWITQLSTDDAGRVWVVTTDGVFVRSGPTFHRLDTGSAFFDPASGHLLAVDDGGVVLDVGGELLRAPVDAHAVGKFSPLLDPRTRAAISGLSQVPFVVREERGRLLFGCGVAICRLEAGRVTVLGTADGLPPDAWQVALKTSDGTLWVRSLDRLAWRKPEQRSFSVVAVPDQQGFSLAGNHGRLGLIADRDGGVLTQSRAGLIDWNGTSWRSYAHHVGGLPTSTIQALLIDREGSLWAGSSGYGAFRSLGRGQWEHWTADDGLPSNTVWSMARLPGGQFWAATDSGTVPIGSKRKAVPGSNYALAATRRGRLWLAPLGAPLVRLEPAGAGIERFPSVGTVLTAAVDHDNRLWLCTRNGLFLVEDADAPRSDVHPRLVLSQPRMQVMTDPSGVVWTVTRNGVFRLGPTGNFISVLPPSFLAGQPLGALFAPGGELWLATEAAGVLRFRITDGHVEPLSPLVAPLISSNAILLLHRDRRGWMWVGTDRGIDVFDGRSWRRFDSGNGPITDDLDEWSVYEDADASMWFGTTHGLSHLIDPARLPAPMRLHPQVTQISLGDKVWGSAPSIHVDWSSAPMVIRFVDLDYAQGRITFRYRLRGLDTAWNETTGHEVRYANVPAGELNFELVAVDTLHGSVSAPVGFKIQVRAPWWRSWWFYGCCAVAGIVLLAGAWQTRIRLLLQHQRRLEEVVSIRTAEIEQARQELQRQSRLEQKRLEEEQHYLEEMVVARTAEIEQARSELAWLAMSDTLTGLLNRRAIMTSLEQAVAEAWASGAPLAVLLCDIDHFKSINDGFGHLAGDAVLASFGSRLSSAVISPELAGRYGGEEFLVIVPEPPEAARQRVAAIHAILTRSPYSFGNAQHEVTTSGGLTLFRPGDTAVTLIARADVALYEAKRNGRNQVREEQVGPNGPELRLLDDLAFALPTNRPDADGLSETRFDRRGDRWVAQA